METKDELVNHIKNWITIDNKIIFLQKQMKDLRIEKKTLSDELMNVMKSNEIECFDIKEGKILYTQSKIKAPLSN